MIVFVYGLVVVVVVVVFNNKIEMKTGIKYLNS